MINQIIQNTRRLVENQRQQTPIAELEKQALAYQPRSLKERLQRCGFGIIAEMKKSSPSAGLLQKIYQPTHLARFYEQSGASGISVLTCPYFFRGSVKHLKQARGATTLPILRKDFLIDPYQILQSRALGADVILLISCLLEEQELKNLAKQALSLGLEPLIEVHNEPELQSVLALDCLDKAILGINNRDLFTLKIDLTISFRLIEKLPRDKIVVISESGLTRPDELRRLKEAGFRGALIGTALLQASDIKENLREMIISCK
ncbi:MAG: indole-3-glycerol phosphate synthase TrpC [Candidatus Omnitrophica bacterium]|nr:indole-3-glycerol phosphate synthase TrpC [Candidatus Omnitrophota bacterium]